MIHYVLLSFLHFSCIILFLWLLCIITLKKRKKTLPFTGNSSPETALIVPVTGHKENLLTNLLTLLKQDYSSFKVYFIVQDKNDAACPVLVQLTRDFDRASLIYAGKATSCSQKNWNIIAGAKAATTAEILVFCDSGHLAEPDWLHQLVSPLRTNRQNIISSGYHQVRVNRSSIVQIGHAICVLCLRIARMTPGFEQPWGGAMAITREAFDRLEVTRLWASRVVDDVTLASHLKKNGYTTHIPPNCDLNTEPYSNYSDWSVWLTRQWAYLKFVFPVLWFFLGFLGILFTMTCLYCLVIILQFCFSLVSFQEMSGALSALGMLLFFSLLLRSFQPQSGSLFLWFPAIIAALVMAGWCHFQTWFSGSITWAGITYDVGADGRVKNIHRPREE